MIIKRIIGFSIIGIVLIGIVLAFAEMYRRDGVFTLLYPLCCFLIFLGVFRLVIYLIFDV